MPSCAHSGVIDYVGGTGCVCHDCGQPVTKNALNQWVATGEAAAAQPAVVDDVVLEMKNGAEIVFKREPGDPDHWVGLKMHPPIPLAETGE
jgi:hypothetical protein